MKLNNLSGEFELTYGSQIICVKPGINEFDDETSHFVIQRAEKNKLNVAILNELVTPVASSELLEEKVEKKSIFKKKK